MVNSGRGLADPSRNGFACLLQHRCPPHDRSAGRPKVALYVVRLLLALPLAAGILWATFLCTTKSPNPSLDDPATWSALAMFALRSLAGVPFVAYAWLVARCFIRPRRSRVAWLAGSTAPFSLVFAVMQLRSDMKLMIAPEYYSWWGWYEIALPGALAVSCLCFSRGRS